MIQTAFQRVTFIFPLLVLLVPPILGGLAGWGMAELNGLTMRLEEVESDRLAALFDVRMPGSKAAPHGLSVNGLDKLRGREDPVTAAEILSLHNYHSLKAGATRQGPFPPLCWEPASVGTTLIKVDPDKVIIEQIAEARPSISIRKRGTNSPAIVDDSNLLDWPLHVHARYYASRWNSELSLMEEGQLLQDSVLAAEECLSLLNSQLVLEVSTRATNRNLGRHIPAMVGLMVDLRVRISALKRQGGRYEEAIEELAAARKLLDTVPQAFDQTNFARFMHWAISYAELWTKLDNIDRETDDAKVQLGTRFGELSEEIDKWLQQYASYALQDDLRLPQDIEAELLFWKRHLKLGRSLCLCLVLDQTKSWTDALDTLDELIKDLPAELDQDMRVRGLQIMVWERAGDVILFWPPTPPCPRPLEDAIGLYTNAWTYTDDCSLEEYPRSIGILMKRRLCRLQSGDHEAEAIAWDPKKLNKESQKQYLQTLETVSNEIVQRAKLGRTVGVKLEERFKRLAVNTRQTERYGRDERRVLRWAQSLFTMR